jgi:hypothetical protein
MLPTAEHLADPAFRVVLDVMRAWTIGVPGNPGYALAGADHVLVVLNALRRAGLLSGQPSAPPATPELREDLAQMLRRIWPAPTALMAGARTSAQLLEALPEYELWVGGRPGQIPRSLGTSHHLAEALRRAAAAA